MVGQLRIPLPTAPARQVRLQIDLALPSLRVCRTIAVPDAPMRLADLVPLARSLSDEIVEATVQRGRLRGQTVPCRNGCAACCRYLVPVSVPEALRLWDEIKLQPPARCDPALMRCCAAAKRLLATPPPTAPDESGRMTYAQAVGRWYAQLDLPCPFLADEMCTIYENRPVACREYLATSPAEHCRSHWPDEGQRLTPPVSVLEALGRLAAKMDHTRLQALLLPLAPIWAQTHRQRGARTWPARRLVGAFLDILHDLAAGAAQAGAEAA